MSSPARALSLLVSLSTLVACASTRPSPFIFDPQCACPPRVAPDLEAVTESGPAERTVFDERYPRRIVDALEEAYGAPLEETLTARIASELRLNDYEKEARDSFELQRPAAEVEAARVEMALAAGITTRLRALLLERDAAKLSESDEVSLLAHAQAPWTAYDAGAAELEATVSNAAFAVFAACARAHPVAISTTDLDVVDPALPKGLVLDQVERSGFDDLRLDLVVRVVNRFQTETCRALAPAEAQKIASSLVARRRPQWVALVR